MVHISLAAERLATLAGLHITNSLLTSWVVVVLLGIASLLGARLKQAPGTFQAGFELFYEGILNTARDVTGSEKVAQDILPFVLTIFLYILCSNWFGLIPGVGSLHLLVGGESVPLFRAPTADLNTALALAICTVLYVQYLGLRHLGAGQYLSKFFTLKTPLDFFVGIQEFVSELTRVISFSFRLFGNIFAGEVMIAVVISLTSTLLPYIPILPLPFYILEVGVGLIQAFVFAFLAIIFIGIAITPHGQERLAEH